MDHIARELADFERRWDDGDFPALLEALLFCHTSGAVIPLWLVKVVSAELHASFHGFGPRERGMTRSHKARMERAAIQMERAVWAQVFLADRGTKGSGRVIDGRPMTRAQAFEMVSHHLRGSKAFGSPAEIEKAYNAERRKERKHLRETGETT